MVAFQRMEVALKGLRNDPDKGVMESMDGFGPGSSGNGGDSEGAYVQGELFGDMAGNGQKQQQQQQQKKKDEEESSLGDLQC